MKHYVYKLLEIDNQHILAGERNGHLEMVDVNQKKVISHLQIAESDKHVYDMMHHRDQEYILCCFRGLSIVSIDNQYNITHLITHFKGVIIKSIQRVSNNNTYVIGERTKHKLIIIRIEDNREIKECSQISTPSNPYSLK